MIRQFVIMVFTFIIGRFPGFSQDLSVSSMKMIQTDSTCLTSPRYDLNGHACAVIKVFTNNLLGLLYFKGNIIGDVKTDESLYTIYVTDRTKKIKVYHPNYIPKTIDFTQYEDSKNGIEGNHVYYISISGNNTTKSEKMVLGSGSRNLIFTSNAEIRHLFVNGIEWNHSSHLLPYGEYEYEAVSEKNVRKKGKVKLTPSIGSMVVNIEFDNQ